MEQLQISKANALTAFNKADQSGKQLLQNLFGEKTFAQKITDRVKTYEDACDVLGIQPSEGLAEDWPEYMAASGHAAAIEALCKLVHIVRALNEGWTPDWSNNSEYKYIVWLEYKSGSGLSFLGCGHTCAVTVVGSRLCFKSSQLAEYAGEQFEDLYRTYFSL